MEVYAKGSHRFSDLGVIGGDESRLELIGIWLRNGYFGRGMLATEKVLMELLQS